MEWKPLQSIAKGFVLTDLLKPEFVECNIYLLWKNVEKVVM